MSYHLLQFTRNTGERSLVAYAANESACLTNLTIWLAGANIVFIGDGPIPQELGLYCISLPDGVKNYKVVRVMLTPDWTLPDPTPKYNIDLFYLQWIQDVAQASSEYELLKA